MSDQDAACDLEDSCKPYDTCREDGTCLSVKTSEGPANIDHNIRSEYKINVVGVTIDLIKTHRVFNATWSTTFSTPTGSIYATAPTDGDQIVRWLICPASSSTSSPKVSVSEDCEITSSTLHYLDVKNAVCLYRSTRDTIHMRVDSTDMAQLKGTWGTIWCHEADIKTDSYTAERVEDWILVINGIKQIVSTNITRLHPFGGENSGSVYDAVWNKFIKVDKTIRKILLFPQPPSLGIPMSDNIRALGFYDYGNEAGDESALNKADGGNKDMFYPEWCRNLQFDPFWRKAADDRYAITWMHSAPNSGSYFPPGVSVDPIPRGSFVRHPKLGDVYQFLIGDKKTVTSPDLVQLINKDLILYNAFGTQEKHAAMSNSDKLYYPISIY